MDRSSGHRAPNRSRARPREAGGRRAEGGHRGGFAGCLEVGAGAVSSLLLRSKAPASRHDEKQLELTALPPLAALPQAKAYAADAKQRAAADDRAATPAAASGADVWREEADRFSASTSGLTRVRRLRGIAVGRSVVRHWKPCKARFVPNGMLCCLGSPLPVRKADSGLHFLPALRLTRLSQALTTPFIPCAQKPLARETADLPARADFDHSSVYLQRSRDGEATGPGVDVWTITKDAVTIDEEVFRVLLQAQQEGGGPPGFPAGGPARAR